MCIRDRNRLLPSGINKRKVIDSDPMVRCVQLDPLYDNTTSVKLSSTMITKRIHALYTPISFLSDLRNAYGEMNEEEKREFNEQKT